MLQKFPRLTVDVIIPDHTGKVLLIARGHDPFKGAWCLPGGMVDEGETVEHAAVREVREETGLEVRIAGVFAIRSQPGRDPRGHYISIVLLAHPTDAEPGITGEATALMKLDRDVLAPMAFDHEEIIRDHWHRTHKPDGVILR